MFALFVLAFSVILTAIYHTLPLPYPYDESWPAAVDGSLVAIHSRAFPANLALDSPTTKLISAKSGLVRVPCLGCESIDFKGHDELVTIDRLGNLVVRLKSSLDVTKEVYVGQGRPLGFEHDEISDTVVICNSLMGLLEYHYATDDLRVLDSTNLYVNDVSIDPTNPSRIFYSSSTSAGRVVWNTREGFYDTMRTFLLVWWRGDVSGSLLTIDRTGGKSEVLVDGLFYANGVAATGDAVFVVETLGLRVKRYDRKTGAVRDFVTDLPGFPDGVKVAADGKSLLVALVAPLSPLLKATRYPTLRWALAHVMFGKFTHALTSKLIKRFGAVVRVDLETRKIIELLVDPTGEFLSSVSAVREDSEGGLYFGNLSGGHVSIMR